MAKSQWPVSVAVADLGSSVQPITSAINPAINLTTPFQQGEPGCYDYWVGNFVECTCDAGAIQYDADPEADEGELEMEGRIETCFSVLREGQLLDVAKGLPAPKSGKDKAAVAFLEALSEFYLVPRVLSNVEHTAIREN